MRLVINKFPLKQLIITLKNLLKIQIYITNMNIAAASNKRFKADINDYNIDGITIKKGETAYELITIKSKKYNSLTLKLKN